jgi:hypothetical protein
MTNTIDRHNPSQEYEQIAAALAHRAEIDPDRYIDLLEDIGRALSGGGPIASPAMNAYAEIDEKIAKKDILPRIDEELIEEHKETPIGKQSDDLKRVLIYFRRQTVEDKYVIIETEKEKEWRIGKTTGVRGERPELVDDRVFSSQKEAEHAVFVRRVEDLRDKFDQ